MTLRWSEELAVGVEEIDLQHKAFFDESNNFMEAYRLGRWKVAIEKVIRFLECYIATHFDAEEKLQKKYAYPDYRAHKAQHRKFRKDFSDLKRIFKKEGATPRFVMLIAHIMSDWAINHTGQSDKALGLFLKEKRGKEG